MCFIIIKGCVTCELAAFTLDSDCTDFARNSVGNPLLQCDEDGHVTYLNFHDDKLKGTVPKLIQTLSYLTFLVC